MTVADSQGKISTRQMWSAVGSMAMCVTMLVASEFMPVSLLTPIADDLQITEGLAGQAVSVSGLFAVMTSLSISPLAGRFDRRYVLLVLTSLMLASLLIIAEAPDYGVLMVARAVLGVAIGGFWALSTATVMRLVPAALLPKALGVLYGGDAIASAFSAPIGSYLGGAIGWRGVFWGLVPMAILNLAWQWMSLPAMAPQRANSINHVLALLERRQVRRAMVALMFTFAGIFCTFTYLRVYLGTLTHGDVSELSGLLLLQGVAGFAGTYAATVLVTRHLYRLLLILPLAIGLATLGLLLPDSTGPVVAILMICCGALNASVFVIWSTWLTQQVADDPETGSGLMIATIQIAIIIGAGVGGLLLDHFSIIATFSGGAALLFLASRLVADGSRIGADRMAGEPTTREC